MSVREASGDAKPAAQAFKLPAGASGSLAVERTGQDRRLTLLLLEALLILATVATMARPTRVAPPVAPTTTVDDTAGDFLPAGLARPIDGAHSSAGWSIASAGSPGYVRPSGFFICCSTSRTLGT